MDSKKGFYAFNKLPEERQLHVIFLVLIINIKKDGILEQNQIEQYHCIIPFTLPQHPQITELITKGKIMNRPLSLSLIIKTI